LNQKFFRLIVFIGIPAILIQGCANRVVPEGGSKDTSPPELLSTVPESGLTNFKSDEIILTFNEYVQLKDLSGQLVISPPMKSTPFINVRKRSIVIELPDSLKENTTYLLNFGNAIADNNEGNPFPDYQYVFSTGDWIDTAVVSGNVKIAQNLLPEKEILVLLYSSGKADSVFLTTKPDYFSKTDSQGNYIIKNVRNGRYRIFALADKNRNLVYDQNDELVGFESDEINLTDSLKIDLYLSKQPSKVQKIVTAQIIEPGKLMATFSKPAKDITWNFISAKPDSVFSEWSVGKDTVFHYTIPFLVEPVKVIYFEEGNVLDTVNFQRQRGSSAAVPKIAGWSFSPANNGTLQAESQPYIQWSAPLTHFDSSKFSLLKDSVAVPFMTKFMDSLNTKIVLEAKWATGVYKLKLLPQAVTDLHGRTNDSITVAFSVANEREKGSISFKLEIADPTKYLLQLVSDKHELVRQRSGSKILEGTFEMVDPGIYNLRLVEDFNNNGRWDGSDYLNKIQHEKVIYNSEKIIVRANWDVEINWKIE
jgi:hypothetical protein